MRLIDADEAYKVLTDYYHQRTEIQHEALKEALSKVPTIDAVEVVRCKDCRFYSEDGWGYGNCYRRNVDYLRMSDNGFCSFGERREDETC